MLTITVRTPTRADIFSYSNSFFFVVVVLADDAGHAGGQIVFTPDNRFVFLTTGDKYGDANVAQMLTSTAGKIMRFHKNGTIPMDNMGRTNTSWPPAMWAYGW